MEVRERWYTGSVEVNVDGTEITVCIGTENGQHAVLKIDAVVDGNNVLHLSVRSFDGSGLDSGRHVFTDLPIVHVALDDKFAAEDNKDLFVFLRLLVFLEGLLSVKDFDTISRRPFLSFQLNDGHYTVGVVLVFLVIGD